MSNSCVFFVSLKNAHEFGYNSLVFIILLYSFSVYDLNVTH